MDRREFNKWMGLGSLSFILPQSTKPNSIGSIPIDIYFGEIQKHYKSPPPDVSWISVNKGSYFLIEEEISETTTWGYINFPTFQRGSLEKWEEPKNTPLVISIETYIQHKAQFEAEIKSKIRKRDEVRLTLHLPGGLLYKDEPQPEYFINYNKITNFRIDLSSNDPHFINLSFECKEKIWGEMSPLFNL